MGDRFGPYEILEPLASGGMARVFRARMTGALGFEKIVALKFMLPGFAADPLAVKMFGDEARLAATLTHANIVGILDFGERNGDYYIAMEYVAGANVRVLLKRAAETARLPVASLAAYVVAETACGLEYAHTKTDSEGRELRIVHRDVSPQNVVVSWEGEVKILDFGIARSRDRSFETVAGIIKGKYPYMSPEQASGLDLDHRSDLFSLGSVLYELLTGEKAFPQPGLAALKRVRHAEFVPPESIRPGLPPPLLAVVRRALARDPDLRYPSASAMLEDLRLYMADERSRGAPPIDAPSIAAWVGGLFEISDSDIFLDEPAPQARAPRGPRQPSPTVRASMTFTGADELDTGADASATRITQMQVSMGETVASSERVLPPLFPPPVRAPRSSGSGIPPNAPATQQLLADVPKRFGARAPVILFLGGLTGAALMTGIIHLATGPDVAAPTPTPAPSAIPSPIDSEALPVETPLASASTAGVIAIADPLTARPGEKRIGLLSISSEPARGRVFLDGKPIAESPVLIPNVPAARRYVVEVRLDGHSPWSREVDVVDDQAVQIVANLVPLDVPGKLRFLIPRGSAAFVDGRLVGKGPVNITIDTYPGKHQLRFKDPNGVILREYEVLVASGRLTEIELAPP